MDLDDLKKGIWGLVIMGVIGWYISTHYTFRDVLAYSHKNPQLSIAPAIDYYAGMGGYMREDYDLSIEAFTQLLTDHPTTQYTPDAMYRLAAAYIERSNYEKAREVFDKYFEEYPKDKKRQDAEKKYEYIKFK